jgi:hypothetical protein
MPSDFSLIFVNKLYYKQCTNLVALNHFCSVRNKYMFAFQIKTVIAYNHIKRLKKEITHFFTNILELEPITSKY